MKRPSTEGGAGRVNGRTAPRIARAKVVALGARHERRKPVPAADLAIARLLIADKTHKQIAEATGLSSRTVGHYVERLKLRCGASTMHGLVGSLLRGT